MFFCKGCASMSWRCLSFYRTLNFSSYTFVFFIRTHAYVFYKNIRRLLKLRTFFIMPFSKNKITKLLKFKIPGWRIEYWMFLKFDSLIKNNVHCSFHFYVVSFVTACDNSLLSMWVTTYSKCLSSSREIEKEKVTGIFL